ncbi:AT-rich interactive domain-containing protein 3A-like [Gadus chalcogrammus]|uniref:AT-rich interactive domain-containing protein 3A-like n=1 Tax=Gadus chalcogrammus TaxID=1042646 RepID=UPI0024C4BA6C|nr:AT-rich interactive domain-containing protein 3A-like [Gadus chalcogrammus]
MMDYSKAQMEGSSAGAAIHQGNPAGVKLEAVMEHLQRQLEAKLDHPDKQLQQAQLLFAKHSAEARAFGSIPDSSYFGRGAADVKAHRVGGGHQTYGVDPGLRKGDLGESYYDDGGDEERKLDESEGTDEMDEEDDDDDEEDDDGEGVPGMQMKKPRLHQDSAAYYSALSLAAYSASSLAAAAAKRPASPPPLAVKEEPEEKELASSAERQGFTSPDGFADWSFDESSKHRASAADRSEENEGGKARGEPSRDFAKLYEIDGDPNRKEFLDDLFIFMQKRGTPVNRIPIMAKQVLDLYRLYKLVTEKGGLVEVINKKIWREITRGLNLPTSITSAAFTLRTQYMKYLYAFECERKRLSSPGELQAAIDGNRREGKRSSYTNSQYHYSPSPTAAPRSAPLSVHAAMGHNGIGSSPNASFKMNSVESSTPTRSNGRPMVLALGQQQLAQAAALEHLREKAGEGPDKTMARMAEEHQRLMQQAFQQNLLAMASHFSSMNHLKPSVTPESKPDLSLSIGTNGAAGINVSVEVNGIVYSGMLYAQKAGGAPVVSQNVTPAGTSGFSALSSHSPSSSSSSSSK